MRPTSKLSEGGPGLLLVIPTGAHNGIEDGIGTGVRLGKTPAIGHIDSLEDLATRESSPRYKAVGEHLPEGHTVGPDIAGTSETQLVNGLQRAPSNGKAEVGIEIGLIVRLAQLQCSAQPEIPDFNLGKKNKIKKTRQGVETGALLLHLFKTSECNCWVW